ncbi:protease complex subunit PrcB family protein [Pseudoduganella namucuonensis]|uniref:Lipoprotein n=1 Tax=Pseudoduganella namucuonensis TaxID=1035707 RepID=A0A1I7L1H6_9BURK|nr:protease complex subunit PrcB family protein [Pseudoduganella namucuonensis]SFV03561.1 hypothetical protein SAMN05216552_10228 [Pseudoduganella namucuonensis]
MSKLALVFGSSLLTAAMLSACGGGDGGAAEQVFRLPDTQPIAVGEPSPASPVAKEDFIKMARDASCADVRNKLYVIDDHQVFWDVAGNCADASYSHALYGPQPQLKLCSSGDSIAGPRTSCADERYREMFDTIVKNRDKADLGLGVAHKVAVLYEQAPAVQAGAPVVYRSLVRTTYTGVYSAKNVVVENLAGWEALWKEINANYTEPPPMPMVDFTSQVVVGVFIGGRPDGCHGVDIIRTSSDNGALRVEYEEYGPSTDPMVACTMAITSPASVVAVDRPAGKVVFESIKTQYLKPVRVEMPLRPDVDLRPYNVVVKDEAALLALWAAHVDKSIPAPKVDFAKSMALFAFGGLGSPGCNTTTFTRVSETGGKVYAEVRHRKPGPATLCLASIVATGELVVVDRGDAPVLFVESTELL